MWKIQIVSFLSAILLSLSYVKSEDPGAITAKYGSWESPITSQIVSGGLILTNDVEVDCKGNVYWVEIRSSEGGRGVICSKSPNDSNLTEWTPSKYSVRTPINGYGGGAFFLGPDGVYFTNSEDQRVYRQKNFDEEPEALTTDDSVQIAYGDGKYINKLKKFVIVREDSRQFKNGKEIETTIVIIDPETKEEDILLSGADFYGSPVISNDGKQIAWCQWNFPNMPFDTTEIWTAEFDDLGKSLKKDSFLKVAGIPNNSVILPKWSLDNELYFIDDRTNWWNLYHYNKTTKQSVNIIPKEKEIGGPQWVFGLDGYAFGWTNKKIYTTYDGELGEYDIETGNYKILDLGDLKPAGSGVDVGFYPANTIVTSPDGCVYTLLGGHRNVSTLVCVHPDDLKIDIIRSSSDVSFDEGYISVAEAISFPTENNMTAYGFYYAPKNKDYVGPSDELPPLMVRAHGGPTGSTDDNLNFKHQYLTSRGIAVLDVNYRGSTGYGRIFREYLNKNWGIYDVDDVCNGAMYLVNQKKVDGKRLAIDGKSAGGYATLSALTFRKVFNVGISYYGISDLEALLNTIEKFESQYLYNLVGPYPEAQKVYYDRSPINFVNQLDTPMAFFQGEKDIVVAPAQAERMFEAVKEKGILTSIVKFPDEGHGFYISENIQKSIDGELFFMSKAFGFQAANISVDMEIFNLK